MGYIKEPKGIDLVVVPQTKPNKEADKLVSDFIKKDKLRKKKNQVYKKQPGFVVCGRRHHNCIGTFVLISGFPYNEFWQKVNISEIQGFITNTNRFVNRKEAYQIAYSANQIIGPNKGYPTNEIGLTSEDLY